MLNILDWGVIALYMLAIIALSTWSKLRERTSRNAENYLVAHKSMNWVIIALTLFATFFSTISFVAVPGEAYNYGLVMLVFAYGPILFMPLGIWLFIRFFFMAPTFTAYEYLEKRFCQSCRILGSLIFLSVRLFYLGIVFYSTAIIFETMLGWPPLLTITVISIITIGYCFFGGVKAIIFADVFQAIIIFIAVFAILIALLLAAGFDLGAVFVFARENGRALERFADPQFYRLNVHDRWNFWLLAWGVIIGPLMGCCDQMSIQRLLAGKNYKSAVRSYYTNYFISIPLLTMLYMIGLLLYFIYNREGGLALPEEIPGDQVMGYFVNTALPAPLPGLVITAFLAALMSTIAGGVNCLVTVFLKDIVATAAPKLLEGEREMIWCYVMTVVIGVLAMITAMVMIVLGQAVRTTVMEIIAVWGALWVVLFSAFFYGVLSKRVSSRAILVSMAISGVVAIVIPMLMYYGMPEGQRWGFQWVGIPATICALTLPPLLSFIWPNRKDIDGLTIYTARKNHNFSQMSG